MSATRPRLTPRLFALTGAEDLDRAVLAGLGDQRRTLDEPTVDGGDQPAGRRRGGPLAQITVAGSTGPLVGRSRGRLRAGAGGTASAGTTLPGLARHANDELAGDAHVEADQALAEQLRHLVHAREVDERLFRSFLALGKREHFARVEAQIPAATAHPGCASQHRLQLWGGGQQAGQIGGVLVGGRANHQRKIGHGVELDRLEARRRRGQ
jgi:hypothetical protein